MELDALKSMWQLNEAKKEMRAKINTALLDKMQSKKVKSIMQPLLTRNWIVLSLHLIFIIALLVFFIYHISDFKYAGSAAILLLYYFYLTINCIQQISAIKKVTKRDDIIGKQAALSELNSRSLNIVRLSILSIPVFLSFPVVVLKAFQDLQLNYFNNLDIISHTNGKWWTVELIVAVLFIPAGIWFYNKLSASNMKEQWVNDIIRNTTSKRAYQAALFLNEIKDAE